MPTDPVAPEPPTPQAALAAALAEIERHCPCGARPKSPHTHHHALGCPVEAAIIAAEAAEAQATALREALEKYGQHRYPCAMGGDWIGSVSVVPKDAVCDCGLAAALAPAAPEAAAPGQPSKESLLTSKETCRTCNGRGTVLKPLGADELDALLSAPAPETRSAEHWECGCGAINGVNLATCAVCHRERSETRFEPPLPQEAAKPTLQPLPADWADAANAARGLCESEANRWEATSPKTAEHWRSVSTRLGALFLAQDHIGLREAAPRAGTPPTATGA